MIDNVSGWLSILAKFLLFTRFVKGISIETSCFHGKLAGPGPLQPLEMDKRLWRKCIAHCGQNTTGDQGGCKPNESETSFNHLRTFLWWTTTRSMVSLCLGRILTHPELLSTMFTITCSFPFSISIFALPNSRTASTEKYSRNPRFIQWRNNGTSKRDLIILL